MSKISTVIDDMRVEIAALASFAGKCEIPMPYSLPDNDDNTLVDSWGLVVGTSTPSIGEFKSLFEDYNVSVVLTREVWRTGHDNDRIHTEAKAILEDALTVKLRFMADSQLDIPASIVKLDFESQSAVDFLVGDKNNFLSISVNFLLGIRENIT